MLLIAEIGYCAVLGFLKSAHWPESFAIAYLILLFAVPLGCNLYWYVSARAKASLMGKHYAVIAQLIVLFFSVKFLV